MLLTVLLLFRGRGWLVFGLSAIAAEVAADVPTFTVVEALLFGLTNVAETTLVFALLRSVRFDPRFGALADLPKFVLSGPLLGALVAAGFGALRRSTRTGEMVARYGGEEFVFLIPETTLSGAVAMMERIRQALKSEEVETGKGPVRITASFGVALLEDADSDLDQTLRRADRALYEAKDGGRDRVVAAGRAVVQNRTE